MDREPREQAVPFAPPRSFDELMNQALGRLPLSNLPPVTDIARIRKELGSVFPPILVKEIKRAQQANTGWLGDRFTVLGTEFPKSFLDGLLVNSEGRVVSAWDTYHTYLSNRQLHNELPLTSDNLTAKVLECRQVLIPLSSPRDSRLFWFYDQEKLVRALFEREGIEFNPEEYPVDAEVASHLPSPLRMGTFERGKIANRMFAQGSLALGKLGFWERPSYQLRYVPRVVFERLGPNQEDVVISPLPRGKVIASGGLPMDEKPGHNVVVLRTNPELITDFIGAAALAFTGGYSQPCVFRFNTYRPWLGEFPQHGESHREARQTKKITSRSSKSDSQPLSPPNNSA